MTGSRRNPLELRGIPVTPPSGSSRRAHELTRAAATGRFALQRCGNCGAFAYPVREACPACLSPDLPLTDAPDTGTVLSLTEAEVPADPYFRARAPIRVGLVRLTAGPVALAFLHPACRPGDAARLRLILDRSGRAVLYAAPTEGDPVMADDPIWREMTSDPKGRRVLITDGQHPCALPLARALIKAGAAEVLVGVKGAESPAIKVLGDVSHVTLTTLDLTDEASVSDAAMQHGNSIDIVIETSDLPYPGTATDGPDTASPAIEAMVLGPMRLARAFAPALAARRTDGATAWVTVLPIWAKVPPPGWAAYAAAGAAALALAQGLRAELAPSGIRLLTVFTGPTEAAAFRADPGPKVTGRAIAEAIVAGLTRGLEEVYVGDVARDLAARLDANPKAVEREMAGGGA